MKGSIYKSILFSSALLIAGITSCKKEKTEESTPTQTKTTFTFERNGVTTVDYSGQTTRLAMLSEMVSYIKGQITNNAIIDAEKLKEMYAGTGFTNPELNTSGKQLKDKTNINEILYFEKAIDSLAANSLNINNIASIGNSGVMVNGEKKYLVDANGVEWLQLFEKGLMGAVFYYQSVGSQVGYLDKIELDDNATIVDGQNYTIMEHHFDEAFGYFGVPTNFPTVIPTEFWGKYCNAQDANISSNSIMTNFIAARQAIVENDMTSRDAQVSQIMEKWEKISASQALTYLESFKTNISGNPSAAYHALSEAYTFIYNLKFSNIDTRKLTSTQVNDLLVLLSKNINTGDINFYNISISDVNTVITSLKSAYGL